MSGPVSVTQTVYDHKQLYRRLSSDPPPCNQNPTWLWPTPQSQRVVGVVESKTWSCMDFTTRATHLSRQYSYLLNNNSSDTSEGPGVFPVYFKCQHHLISTYTHYWTFYCISIHILIPIIFFIHAFHVFQNYHFPPHRSTTVHHYLSYIFHFQLLCYLLLIFLLEYRKCQLNQRWVCMREQWQVSEWIVSCHLFFFQWWWMLSMNWQEKVYLVSYCMLMT